MKRQLQKLVVKMVVKYYLMQYVMNGGYGGCALTPEQKKAMLLVFWI